MEFEFNRGLGYLAFNGYFIQSTDELTDIFTISYQDLCDLSDQEVYELCCKLF